MIVQIRNAAQVLSGRFRSGAACAAAALVAALLVMGASPALAQDCTGEGPNVCGFVWNDANNNGIQDVGEGGLEGVRVTVYDGTDTLEAYTDSSGFYQFTLQEPGTYTFVIATSSISPGTQVAPTDATDDAFDSDGVDDTFGNSVVTGVVEDGATKLDFDFGFYTPSVQQPGTGTPGYWKNHAEAWPVSSLTVGGIAYSKAEAIAWLGKVGKDKTTTMFSSLVPAMLNVIIGNDSSCVATTIIAANAWMAAHPVGSKVAASSAAWADGEPWHIQMDSYNNGLLCAPHRN